MQEGTFSLRAHDGTDVHVYRWLPDEGVAARGVIHLVHGMAEHALRYKRLAERATSRGLAVYASDLRGHGRTMRSTAEQGFFAAEHGWRAVLDDLGRLCDHVTREHPELPRVLMGHSMGSFFAQQLMFERGEAYAGYVLSASVSGVSNPLAPIGRFVAREERWRVGARSVSRLLTTLSFGQFNRAFRPNRTEYDWLSRDPAEVDKYIADPLCGFECTTQLWIDLLDALGALAAPESVARVPKSRPLYLMGGAEDPVLGPGAKGFRMLEDQYRRAGLTRVTAKLYPGARHELLNETNRDEVTHNLLDWIDQEALPGAAVGH